MALNGFRIDVGDNLAGDLCFDSAVVTGKEQTQTSLEQEVTDLFNTLSDSVFVYLISVFGHPTAADADDITQETFVKLYRTLRDGRQIENAKFWLFRVAYNLAIDRIRSNQFVAFLDDAQWSELEKNLSDRSFNPEQQTLRREEFAHLNAAMKRLSRQERECLHLRAEGFRYREIGQILDISIPAVSEFLRRAIRKLTPARDE